MSLVCDWCGDHIPLSHPCSVVTHEAAGKHLCDKHLDQWYAGAEFADDEKGMAEFRALDEKMYPDRKVTP